MNWESKTGNSSAKGTNERDNDEDKERRSRGSAQHNELVKKEKGRPQFNTPNIAHACTT